MPTNDDDGPIPPPSRHALHVMGLLGRRAGTMRMGPLLEACGLTTDELAAAVNELAERRWVTIVWRGPDARRPETLPARLREARRVVTTRFGRWRYRRTWVV
jgi:hypothetical protein